MFTKIDIKEAYLCQCENANEVRDWEPIKRSKTSYIEICNPNWRLLRFPGFCFSNEDSAKYYYKNFYSKIENVFTPPRGNLSESSHFAFIGIKPGSLVPDPMKVETCWLWGPSSKMLYDMLVKKGIYPYFTNVYRSCHDEENKDVSLIMEELNIIKKICPDIIPVFMGSYEEYNIIIEKMHLSKFFKIWHPSYLVRSFSQQKFLRWCYQLS